MNISPQNIAGVCNYKCAYSFNYNTSNITATNYGRSVSLKYESSSTPQVTYNAAKYNVSNIQIFSPSLQSYNNAKASAEIIITHTPINGGKPMQVFIPISTSGPTTTGSQIITDIFTAIVNNAPSNGTSTTQGIKSFTLNDIVPMKHFYSYTTNNEDIIAYGIENAINVSDNSLKSFQKCIMSTDYSMPSGPELFSNPDGPTNGDIGDGNIYIDCQPTNSSEEEVNMVVDIKAPVTYDIGTYIFLVITNPIFLLLCASAIFIILLLIIRKLITYISDDGAPSIPLLSKVK